ncbi:signal peptidase I [Anaeromicropila herbilytica]|uniref:Signal peptidase I n=1 Tax=Anaeromicropila herbilytica TaxID=2785025 RepID=A0A7R7IBR9_9FIRM|nr:signal peptidase I [Anaeromicropila herbilytica]BCN29119.1 signal peptidase I [Anaeromicropila herbilytica]
MRNKKNTFKEIINLFLLFIGTIFFVMLFNTTVLAKVQVEQTSMENTLLNKQQLLVDKLSYRFSNPQREDIIIFLPDKEKGSILDESLATLDQMMSTFSHYKQKDTYYVKRVIGVAGDKVDIKNGYVYVNDVKLDEPYTKGETIEHEIHLPLTVGKNKLFVMGDHRSVSMDSRSFGVIDLNQVEGKAIFRVYPWDKVGRIQ